MIARILTFSVTNRSGHSRPPWPFNPVLDLPGGPLEIIDATLVTNHGWVVRVPSREKCDPLLEQAVGFWSGRDAYVVRMPIRCSKEWFRTMPTADLDVHRCVLFWVRNFFAADPCNSTNLPFHIWPVIPLADVLAAGHRFWLDAHHVLAGLEAYDSDFIYDVAPLVSACAWQWEYHVARWIRRITGSCDISPFDQETLIRVDRDFIAIVSRFLPAHEVLSWTIARLL